MVVSEPATLVDFDADEALEAGRDVAGSEFGSCIEYTREANHTLYVSESVAERYRDRDHMEDHFDELLRYCYIDFSERRLFEELLPPAGDVDYFVTRMDGGFIARLLCESQGLFVYLLPDAPVEETLEAMATVMHETDTVEESPYST